MARPGEGMRECGGVARGMAQADLLSSAQRIKVAWNALKTLVTRRGCVVLNPTEGGEHPPQADLPDET